ncbi:MAG: ABC transporter ATP-binding protein [Candidatus Micrarchaeales archaeon]|jgi:ABC-type multidrug transport system ATPase subunit
MGREIVVKSLVKRFGKTIALENVSFASRSGINMILGPNGAGKSTLLRCIAGLYSPDHGSISIQGLNPYENTELRRNISYLADNYGLYDFLTIRQNLSFFGRFYGLESKQSVDKVKGLLKELDLGDRLDTKVETLSRGMKQKAAFCRTMLNDADVLLLDEPTAFLDLKSSEAIRLLLQELAAEKRTILFVTQKLDEVVRFNSRILMIRKGRIVKDMEMDKLYKSIFSNAEVTIRVAKPISGKLVASLDRVVKTNGANPTSVTIRVSDYKQINDSVSRLMDGGAYVVSIDYFEPALDKLMFGGKNAN